MDNEQKSKYTAPISKKDIKNYKLIKAFLKDDQGYKNVIAPYVQKRRRSLTRALLRDEHGAFDIFIKKKPAAYMANLSQFLTDEINLSELLHETSLVIKTVTKASGVHVYLVDDGNEEIHFNTPVPSHHKIKWQIGLNSTVAAYVAYTKEFIMIDDILEDPRFPEGIGYKSEAVKAVLCIPVVTPEDNCIAVIELHKYANLDSFTKEDLQIVVVVTGWMGAAIQQNQQRVALEKQKRLNDYLLDLTKCYFSENVELEKMITEIVKFAKETVGAERGSFYILDRENNELIADYFDEGVDEDINLHRKNLRVRVGKDKGIAALVASTGESINIKNALNDPRCGKEIDVKSGLITRNLIAMPIAGSDSILGVMQLVNKLDGKCFTVGDEYLLQTFCIYSALVLHYSKISETLYMKGRLTDLAEEVLRYHLQPCIHDSEFFYENVINIPEDISEFPWYITPEQENYMPHFVLYMFINLLGKKGIDVDALMKFILTVRKGYRKNDYHNWEHAFNVCHCMYVILYKNMEIFTELEKKALLVATICHDLDHRGFTNNFLIITSNVIAQLYDESPLENHHCYMTKIILEDNIIFPTMDSDTYKIFWYEIREAIIATDLALYFKCRIKLAQINADPGVDMNNFQHRSYVKQLIMTTCDLSAMFKPFSIAKIITESLYREFYKQGDREKQLNLIPLSMMDRDKRHLLPDDQVQFLTIVVIPCNELLSKILPETLPTYEGSVKLRDAWKEIVDLRGQKCWRQSESCLAKD